MRRTITVSAVAWGLFQGAGCGASTDNADELGAISLSLHQGSNANSDAHRYIVSFANPSQAQATLRSIGARAVLNLPALNAAAVFLPARALTALEHHPNVVEWEIDAKRYPLGETTPYGISMIQTGEIGKTLAGNTTVCVIDSGIWRAHEDLPLSRVVASSDGGAGDAFEDGCGHGTHDAGTNAAVQNDWGVVGVNSNENLNLHIVKVFGNDCGWAYSSSLIQALARCQSETPPATNVVVNMSLGGARKSKSEERAFDQAFGTGRVLSIAAAGNDGSTRKSYPASYDSVISVGAVDALKSKASFSQSNSQVEFAAPGVAIRSTMMSGAIDYSPPGYVALGTKAYEGNALVGSPEGDVTARLVDCGLGDSPCAASDSICLFSRGALAFSDKVLRCEQGGGIAAAIFNNEAGPLLGTLGEVETQIPSVGLSKLDGAALQLAMELNEPLNATVSVSSELPYTTLSGTSMATPHVSGGAALLWSHFPLASNSELRSAMQIGSEDLGSAGRDDSFGFGLLALSSSWDALDAGNLCPPGEICEQEPPVEPPENPTCKDSGAKCKSSSECCSESCYVGGGGPPRCG